MRLVYQRVSWRSRATTTSSVPVLRRVTWCLRCRLNRSTGCIVFVLTEREGVFVCARAKERQFLRVCASRARHGADSTRHLCYYL